MVSAVNTSITKPPPRRRKSHRKETFHESWGGPSARRSRRSTRGVVFLSVGSRSALLPRCFRGVAIGEGLAATRAPGALSPKSKIAEPIQLRRCHRDLPSSLTSPLHTNRWAVVFFGCSDKRPQYLSVQPGRRRPFLQLLAVAVVLTVAPWVTEVSASVTPPLYRAPSTNCCKNTVRDSATAATTIERAFLTECRPLPHTATSMAKTTTTTATKTTTAAATVMTTLRPLGPAPQPQVRDGRSRSEAAQTTPAVSKPNPHRRRRPATGTTMETTSRWPSWRRCAVRASGPRWWPRNSAARIDAPIIRASLSVSRCSARTPWWSSTSSRTSCTISRTISWNGCVGVAVNAVSYRSVTSGRRFPAASAETRSGRIHIYRFPIPLFSIRSIFPYSSMAFPFSSYLSTCGRNSSCCLRVDLSSFLVAFHGHGRGRKFPDKQNQAPFPFLSLSLLKARNIDETATKKNDRKTGSRFPFSSPVFPVLYGASADSGSQ